MRLVLTADGVLRHDQLTFVSHRMGGIVTRAFILKYQRDVSRKIRLLYFFATPTTGSPYAILASTISRNAQFKQLYPMNSDNYLGTLQSSWLAADLQLKSYCAYETQPLLGQIIVDRQSASNLCTQHLDPIEADHISIVKPADETSMSYRALKAAFMETSHTVPSHAAKPSTIDVAGAAKDGARQGAREGTAEALKAARTPTISFRQETKIVFRHGMNTRAPHIECFGQNGDDLRTWEGPKVIDENTISYEWTEPTTGTCSASGGVAQTAKEDLRTLREHLGDLITKGGVVREICAGGPTEQCVDLRHKWEETVQAALATTNLDSSYVARWKNSVSQNQYGTPLLEISNETNTLSGFISELR